MIYHVLTPEEWAIFENKTLPYRAPSLATEGFIHCSYSEQIEGVLSRYYQGVPQILCLQIDETLLDAELLKVELAPNGEHFPHYYGAIPHGAIVSVQPLR